MDIPNGLEGLFPPRQVDVWVRVLNKETGGVIENAKVVVREIKEGAAAYEDGDVFATELSSTQDNELIVRYSVRDELFDNEITTLTDARGLTTMPITESKKYLIVAGKQGFRSNHATCTVFDANYDNPIVEIRLWPISKPVEVVEPPMLEVGSIIVLDQLYYDFDKSYIRTDASKGLDAILALMKEYPAMQIEMTSHTDSRGSKEYNMDLSLRRSASAKYYLTSRGIEESRIKAMGKGEQNPRNRCVDGVRCSEEEHQYNRRTEVKITSLGADKKVEYINNPPEYIDKAKIKKRN